MKVVIDKIASRLIASQYGKPLVQTDREVLLGARFRDVGHADLTYGTANAQIPESPSGRWVESSGLTIGLLREVMSSGEKTRIHAFLDHPSLPTVPPPRHACGIVHARAENVWRSPGKRRSRA